MDKRPAYLMTDDVFVDIKYDPTPSFLSSVSPKDIVASELGLCCFCEGCELYRMSSLCDKWGYCH